MTICSASRVGANSSSAACRSAMGWPARKPHRQIDDWIKEPGVLDDWNDKRPILDM